jgi:hypothetical protein
VGNATETCTTNGTWSGTTACSNKTCVGGVCSGFCAPGQTQCSGLTPQSCNTSGQWSNGTPCAHVCSNGSCTGVCSPNATQCAGNTQQTCDSGGQWQDTETCPYVCANGACTGVCAPGATQCCFDNGTTTVCGPTESGLFPSALGTESVYTQSCTPSGEWSSGAACNGCGSGTFNTEHICTTCSGIASCEVTQGSGASATCTCP